MNLLSNMFQFNLIPLLQITSGGREYLNISPIYLILAYLAYTYNISSLESGKDNVKECSNYLKIAFISHARNIMFKIL